MLAAAANLEFERAAELRDRIAQLKGQPVAAPQVKKPRRRKKTQRSSRRRALGPTPQSLRRPEGTTVTVEPTLIATGTQNGGKPSPRCLTVEAGGVLKKGNGGTSEG